MTVMGFGSVIVTYECEERMKCDICCPHTPPIPINKRGRCRLKVQVDDRISQPTDGHGGWWEDSEGEWWGCEPYDITGEWSDSFSWSEKLGECP